jgi:hypothetical protein
MRITVEIDDQRIKEDEPRAYEDAVNAFAAEWQRRIAAGLEAHPAISLPDPGAFTPTRS